MWQESHPGRTRLCVLAKQLYACQALALERVPRLSRAERWEEGPWGAPARRVWLSPAVHSHAQGQAPGGEPGTHSQYAVWGAPGRGCGHRTPLGWDWRGEGGPGKNVMGGALQMSQGPRGASGGKQHEEWGPLEGAGEPRSFQWDMWGSALEADQGYLGGLGALVPGQGKCLPEALGDP